MAYRKIEEHHHHHHGNRTAQKLTTPAQFWMTNGSTFDLALPCWYREIHKPIRARHHCRDWHDHVGQPTPTHPDQVCQEWDYAIVHPDRISSEYIHDDHLPHPCGMDKFGHPAPYSVHPHDLPHRHAFSRIDMAKLIPIHLTKEGYTTVEVAFEPVISGLTATAEIDESDDWVIRVHFKAIIDMEDFEPVRTKFAVRVYNKGKTECDVAAIAEVIVMPAAR